VIAEPTTEVMTYAKFKAEVGNEYHPTAPFVPLPWQVAPWRDKSPLVLLTGSSGGGKSRCAGEKAHAFCLKYPGAMVLILRKTAVSHGNSTVIFLKNTIIGDDRRAVFKTIQQRFEYDNGSMMAFMGLDSDEQRKRLRSIGTRGGLDFVWMEEAIEFSEDDINAVLSRMRGRAAPWRQIILTTNPDTPLHWIYRRLILGQEAKVYYSKALDNTYNPADYQATLGRLTGVDKLRLTEGKWVQASGLVYGDVWSDGPEDGNVTEQADYIPDGGPILWGVDDGYAGEVDPISGYFTASSHPRAFVLCQLRTDGVLCVFDENVQIKRLPDPHIQEVREMGYIDGKLGKFVPYPEPDYAVVDKSAAELIGRMAEMNIYTRKSAGGLTGMGQGAGSVEEMIKEVRRRLAKDENGRRLILVHPRCKHLRAEMLSYSRDKDSGKVISAWNHANDGLRYTVWATRWQEA